MSNPPITVHEHFNDGAAKYEASTGGCTRELARHLVDISPPFDEGSHVLDNACGSGIVAQEILRKNYAASEILPTIACVDFAPAMIDLARGFYQNSAFIADNSERAAFLANAAQKISFDVMSGEKLHFQDNNFPHSITNVAILFFKDGPKGAREIHRTLKPGGTAIITSWAKLGYIDLIHQAQRIVKPDAPPFRIPISEQWYQAVHLEKTLRDADFEYVQVHEKKVHYAADSVCDLCDRLIMLFARAIGLSESESTEFRKQLEVAADEVVVKIEKKGALAMPDSTEDVISVPMVALAAVATK